MQGKNQFLIIIGLIVVYSCTNSKDKTVTSTDIYHSYKKQKEVAYFDLPPGIVSVFIDDSQKGNAELKNLLGDINKLTFLVFSKDSNKNKDCKYYNEISYRLDSIHFNDLAQINSGKELIKVKFAGDSNNFNELVFLVSNNNSLYCISMKGNINPQKVCNLVKPENIAAISNLDRFER